MFHTILNARVEKEKKRRSARWRKMMKEYSEGNRCKRNRFFITRRKINPVRLRLSAIATRNENENIRFTLPSNARSILAKWKDIYEMCVSFGVYPFSVEHSRIILSAALKCTAVGVEWIFEREREMDKQIASIRTHSVFEEIHQEMYFINGSPVAK